MVTPSLLCPSIRENFDARRSPDPWPVVFLCAPTAAGPAAGLGFLATGREASSSHTPPHGSGAGRPDKNPHARTRRRSLPSGRVVLAHSVTGASERRYPTSSSTSACWGPWRSYGRDATIRLATSASARGLVALLALAAGCSPGKSRRRPLGGAGKARPGASPGPRLVRARLQQSGADPSDIIDAEEELIGFFPIALTSTPPLPAVAQRPAKPASMRRWTYIGETGADPATKGASRQSAIGWPTCSRTPWPRWPDGARTRASTRGPRDASMGLLARDPLREEGHATLIEVDGARLAAARRGRANRGWCSVLEVGVSVRRFLRRRPPNGPHWARLRRRRAAPAEERRGEPSGPSSNLLGETPGGYPSCRG